jgi:hypothetical protein
MPNERHIEWQRHASACSNQQAHMVSYSATTLAGDPTEGR